MDSQIHIQNILKCFDPTDQKPCEKCSEDKFDMLESKYFDTMLCKDLGNVLNYSEMYLRLHNYIMQNKICFIKLFCKPNTNILKHLRNILSLALGG